MLKIAQHDDSIKGVNAVAVIPAYNEETTIGNVLDNTKTYVDNIIVVDDGSKDNTSQIAKTSGEHIIVLRHKINLGKGAALKTGCEAALKLGADIIITMDADGQHNPDDIPKLLNKMRKENLDIVFGSRKIGKNVPLVRGLGNKLLTKIAISLSGINVNDILSGFRAFTPDAYQKLKWQSPDYSVEAEMLINAGKNKLKYGEIAIETIYNDNYKGMDIISGLKVFLNILKWSL